MVVCTAEARSGDRQRDTDIEAEPMSEFSDE